MSRISLVAAVVALVLSFLAPNRGEACGVWRLKVAKEQEVKFLIHTVSLGKRRIFSIYGKAPKLRAVVRPAPGRKGAKTMLTFSGETLRYRGKRVGKLEGSIFTLGKKRFGIVLGKSEREFRYPVKVVEGEKVIAQSSGAFAFERACGGQRISVSKQQRGVRQQVALYLAWRELVAGKGR